MNLNYNKMNALKFQNIREKRQECFNVDEYTFNDFDFDGKRRRVYSNVNLSIFTDDYCNANCKFCVAQLRFENKGKMYKKSKIASDDEYLSRLDDILNRLRPLNPSISITGGEPTKSRRLVPILRLIEKYGYRKGFVDREMFEYKFDYISNALEDYTDISVSAYYCDSNNKRNANRKPNIGMIKEYMDFIEYMNNDEDEEEKIVYDTILMIGDASGKEGQFSDSDKKTAENFGCEYMDVDDFVDKYKG